MKKIIALFCITMACYAVTPIFAQNSMEDIKVLTASILLPVANPYHLDITEASSELVEEGTILETPAASKEITISSKIKGNSIRLRFDSKSTGKADIYLFDKSGTRLGFSTYTVIKGLQVADLRIPNNSKEFTIKVFYKKISYQKNLNR